MSIKAGLLSNAKTPGFASLTNQLAWTTFDFGIIKDSSNRRRHSRHLLQRNNLASHSSNQLIIIAIITPIVLLHAALFYRHPSPGIIGFPGLQIFTATTFFNPLAGIAADFIASGNPGLAIIVLLLTIIPFIVYTAYVIYNYSIRTPRLCFQEKRSWVFPDPNTSNFLRGHASLFSKYTGKTYQVTPVFEVDPDTHLLVRYKTVPAPKTPALLLIYYTTFRQIKAAIVILLLGSFSANVEYPLIQASALTLITLADNLITIVITPNIRLKDNLLDILLTFIEFITYLLSAFVFIIPAYIPTIEQTLIAIQMVTIGIHLLFTATDAAPLVRTMYLSWQRRAALRLLATATEAIICQVRYKKYANRWKYKTFGVPLKGWPMPREFSVRPILDKIVLSLDG